MADAATVSVLLQAKDNASKEFKNVESNMGKMVEGIQRHRRAIGMAMTAMGAAITGIAAMSVKSAFDQEKGIRQLDVALQQVGTSYEKQKQQIEEVVAAQQNKTNFGDEEQRDALRELILVSGNYDNAMAALIPTMELAAGKEMELGAAATLVARAISGEESALNRYGVSVEKGADATEVLNAVMAKFQGQAEAAADPTTQLKNRTGDLFQALGEALLPVLETVVPLIESMVKRMVEWTEAHPNLTRVLAIVAASLGAVMLVLGPLLLILPQLFAGMKLFAAGIRLVTAATAANPVGIILVALTTLAVVALPLVQKHWDKIWNGILKLTEKVANFIIGILNKLTLIWRKQFDFIANMVAKLLDMGSKLPFVGDSFADAADKIRGFSDRLEEGIPQIDITSGKQEELQDMVHETEMTYEQASSAIKVEHQNIADSSAVMASDVARTNESMVASVDAMADGTGQALNRVSAEYEQHVKDRISHSDMIKEIQASQYKVERQLEADRIQQVKDDFAERVRIKEQEEEARDAANARLFSSLSEVNQKWKESGANVEEVMKLWSQTTDESFEEISAKLDLFDTDLSDAESVVEAFAKGTGESFFDMKDDIASALEEASKTVEEKIADMGRIMDGANFADSMGRSLGLGEGGMRNFQAMSAGQQVEGIKSGMNTLSTQNLSDLTKGGGAVASAAIDAIQEKWANDKQRLSDEMALNEAGFGEVGTGMRLVARNKLNTFLRLGKKTDEDGNPIQLGSDMTNWAWSHPATLALATKFATGMGGTKSVGQEGVLMNMFASGQISAFARGGIVTRPTLGLVGEAGPEAVVPLGRGGGMGATNNFHFHGAVYGVEDLKETVVQAVRDHAISGGFTGVFGGA